LKKSIEYSKEIAEGIALDYPKKKLIKIKTANHAQKVNQKAKVKAASNLMNDLNIKKIK